MRCFIIASILCSAVIAKADAPAMSATPTATTAVDVRDMHDNDCARARAQHKPCVIDMGKGDSIDGNSATANTFAATLIGFGSASSLVHIRRDFITEILKSAEDL